MKMTQMNVSTPEMDLFQNESLPNWIVVDSDPNCTAGWENEPISSTLLILAYRRTAFIMSTANILANSLSAHLFRQTIWRASLMSRLLLSLSVVEVLFHMSILLSLYTKTTGSTLSTVLFTFGMQKMLQWLSVSLHITRNWNVVLLAAYRFECICRPMATRCVVFTSSRLAPLMLGVFFSALLISGPRLFETGIYICAEDPIRWEDSNYWQEKPVYEHVYISVVMLLVQNGGPCVIVTVLSSRVLSVIQRRRRFHKRKKRNTASNIQLVEDEQQTLTVPLSTSRSLSVVAPASTTATTTTTSSAESRSGDKLIIILCFTFFVLEIPAFFSKVLHPYLNSLSMIGWMALLGNVFIWLDSFINIFIYMGSNPTFRAAATQVLRSCALGRFLYRLRTGRQAAPAQFTLSTMSTTVPHTFKSQSNSH